MFSKYVSRHISGIAMALVAGVSSAAASDYPSKPITVVVPYAVGGTTDIVSRIIGQELGKTTGESVVVENRAGGGGIIGWSIVARAKPDGYTLLTTESSLAMSTALKLKMPFDPNKAFTHVAIATSVPYVVVVNPDVPVTTVEELIALAKNKPNELFYGSGGNGTNTHLAAELFKTLADVKIDHVPYKGAGAALNDVLGGQIQMLITALPTALPHIKSGKLKALMVTSDTRSPVLPDVRSASEAGLPGMKTEFWVGYAVPAGTPQDIVEKINEAVRTSINRPDVKQRIEGLGISVKGLTYEESEKLVADDIALWEKTIRDADIKVQ
ncbi:hypothetical protein CR159_06235 [Pollutimonas subterranea]|uniref:Tripartite-type tricarboxylate transporter, receptor component TctC n=1 Tax=Pollutimonas subterranea TaxID=2045210 RepID=A0A2N4U6F9_9BURK|nr:tripartite tricarboxylate transporter substrate binding protein [Pollutimonas subterranea]PLC50608.1 hypothetical protein CR159_06235 [Pollutimonas subterranea]